MPQTAPRDAGLAPGFRRADAAALVSGAPGTGISARLECRNRRVAKGDPALVRQNADGRWAGSAFERCGVPRSETPAEDLRQYVKRRLSAHASPREIGFLVDLPKTPNGTLRRFMLRNREVDKPKAASAA